VQATPRNEAMLAVVGMESGFETDDVASSASRTFSATGWCGRARRSAALDNFISEVTSLAAGDLVVHVDHGIGRFVGLQTHRGRRRAA
jgi:transcription-repair coupling factor (superfamily II helicase)